MNAPSGLSRYAARVGVCVALLSCLSADPAPVVQSAGRLDPAPLLPAAPAPESGPGVDDDGQVPVQPERPIPAHLLESPLRKADRATLDRIARAMRDFDAARNAGPEAVIAFDAAAADDVRAIIAADVAEARQTLAPVTDRLDGDAPYGPPPTGRVGINAACAYPTLQSAVTAAPSGATLQVAQGVFTESVDITGTKTITIVGGYDATCVNLVAGATSSISGTGGSVIDVSASAVSLHNLRIFSGTATGAGIDLYGANARATLSNTTVSGNHGSQGGGIYISYGTAATLTNGSMVRLNAASLYGGGVAVYGRLNAIETYSDINENDAGLDGGGIYASAGTVYLSGSDVLGNRALGATGRGGGIYADSAVITLTSGAYIGAVNPCCNRAHDGAGIYAHASRISTQGSNVVVMNNRATGDGGGLYLAGASALDAAGGFQVGFPSEPAYGNTATLGGGLFVSASTVSFAGHVHANTASDHGGGLYAYNSAISLPGAVFDGNTAKNNGGGLYAAGGSGLTCDGAALGGSAAGNTALAGSGGGVYLSGGRLDADDCVFSNNSAAVNGGGLAAEGATITLRSAGTLDATLPAATAATVFFSNTVVATATTGLQGLGGGIYAKNTWLSLDRAILRGNMASRGGGLLQEGGGAVGWISNTLVYSNMTGQAYGAGIRNAGGALTLTHSTLANNAGGGGVSTLSGAQTFVYNNIIFGNSTTSGGAPVIAVCSIDQSGDYGVITNPRFALPGAGEDYTLQLSSPAIDACESAGATIDLDARARPYGPRFDMGAYEMAVTRTFAPIVLR